MRAPADHSVSYSVVIPTVGRSSLATVLRAVLSGTGAPPREVLVVDDRPLAGPADGPIDDPTGRSTLPLPTVAGGAPVRVLASGGRGPAAARNVGWRAAGGEWVAFLDDDVEPAPDWPRRLVADLAGQPPDVGGSQARLEVPLPADRRPTDWERSTAGLASARWITADLAYRRRVLQLVGGFDERFPRAFREDSDLALRVAAAGYVIVRGNRTTRHPVRQAGPWASVRAQRGNADDVLMWALHGPGWRGRAGAEPGRTFRHLATTAAGLAAVTGALTGRRRLAAAGLAGWAAGTAELAWCRIAPGPGDPREVAVMVATSGVLPPVATAYRLGGLVALPRLLADRDRRPRPGPIDRPVGAPSGAGPDGAGPNGAGPVGSGPDRLTGRERRAPRAVLFDRDGTLVANVPYNRSPEAVRAMPGAAAALDRLRRRGVRIGVVTNQSGVALGLISLTQLAAVHRRVEELLGPIDTWQVYRHRPDEGCGCRKPAPGLVQRAAAALGLSPSECAVVGDIGADVAAAEAAGARGVLVPTAASQAREAAGATCAPDLATAIDLLIGPETGLIGPETGLRPGRSAEAPGDEWHDGTAAEPEAVVRGALR